jgi:hypothetical protein
MNIIYISNYLNHHQLPISKEMIYLIDDKYKFVATSYFNKKRLTLGYKDMNYSYDFVVRSYENEEEAYRLGNDSDVVIIGSAPKKYIKERLKKNRLTFAYSERLFKKLDYKVLLKKIIID